uniref:Putative secreted protein n=1 Tax=Anopheles darlingi TaxID=43151 RepID=A0A2M4D9A2_ANODA
MTLLPFFLGVAMWLSDATVSMDWHHWQRPVPPRVRHHLFSAVCSVLSVRFRCDHGAIAQLVVYNRTTTARLAPANAPVYRRHGSTTPSLIRLLPPPVIRLPFAIRP